MKSKSKKNNPTAQSNISSLVSANIESLENLQLLIDATSLLSASLDYQETLTKVARLATPSFADWCMIHIVDENNKIQQIIVEHKDRTKIKWAFKLQHGYPPIADTNFGISGVLKYGKSVLMSETQEKFIYKSISDPQYLKLLKKLKLKSYMSVPLTARGKVLGVITFVSTESDRHYKLSDLAMVEELAKFAGIAIDNARLYKLAIQAQKEAQKQMEQRKKEEMLSIKLAETQQNRLETILDVMPVALVLVELKSGRVLFSNKTANSIAGGYAAKFGSNNIEGYFATDQKGKLIEIRDWPVNQLAAGKKLSNFFMEWHTPKGRVSLLNTSQLLPAIKLSPKMGVLVFQDITIIKKLEKQKDEFISMASHELKTPVTTIKGFTQILQTIFKSDPKSAYYLIRMNDQVDRLTELVNDLLDVSRMQHDKLEIHKEPIELNQLINDIVTDIQPSAHHQIIFETDGRIMVKADKFRLSQVIINLLNNAIKYSPKKDQVLIRTVSTGDYVKIQIQDFGIGISAKQIGHIFEPFFQANNRIRQSFGGLGLGLHISNEIIKNHQGKIEVDSQKGYGSTFTVLLPNGYKSNH